jgi:hypothetical protein
MAAGIGSFAVGDVVFTSYVARLDPQPFPSVADIGFLGLADTVDRAAIAARRHSTRDRDTVRPGDRVTSGPGRARARRRGCRTNTVPLYGRWHTITAGPGSIGGRDARAEIDQLTEATLAALRAPSILNTQPWRWRVRGLEVALRVDSDRRLADVDPTGRLLLLSRAASPISQVVEVPQALAELRRLLGDPVT